MFVVIILMIFLGFPLFTSFIGGAVVYFLVNENLSLMMLPQKMVGSLDSFSFLAIPFFILAGQIMNRGGITKRIFILLIP
jgi:TRAP-type mannitol/chloroaromatic compound transport system permease large subunit